MPSFDTCVHDPAALRRLVDVVGADRVVLGSDYPFDMGTEDPVGAAKDAGLDDDALERLLGSTAARLLGGVRSAQAEVR
jgi:aminocarboxymuconate-semialdehyde decarboxylase